MKRLHHVDIRRSLSRLTCSLGQSTTPPLHHSAAAAAAIFFQCPKFLLPAERRRRRKEEEAAAVRVWVRGWLGRREGGRD